MLFANYEDCNVYDTNIIWEIDSVFFINEYRFCLDISFSQRLKLTIFFAEIFCAWKMSKNKIKK